MSADPNKKSPRTFQCRDMLWETFEQMARELECSVDYLINEAMKQYARQRSYGQRTPYPGPGGGGGGGGAVAPPPLGPPSMPRGGAPATRPIAGGGLPPPPGRPPAPPPQPSRGMQSGLGMPPPPRVGGGGAPAGRSQPPPRSAPPPIPERNRPGASMPPVPGGGYNGATLGINQTSLNVIYQSEKFPITKDRFVIGRGKQSSDLTLKDPNVSRQHAMIEYQNGVYFMVDMGSTNGVEYNGQRIARKQIAEGDVFRICDHDLRFTYR